MKGRLESRPLPTHRERSWREPISAPAGRFSLVPQAIVQAAGPALPELELGGNDAITTPPLRTRDDLAVDLARDVVARFQRLAALDDLTLGGGVHAPAALDRTRRKV